MNELILGDCHTELEKLEENSIDLVLNDPPYNLTECDWDQQPLDWEKIWTELYRVAKSDAAFVFTASNDFTIELINSNRSDYQYSYTWIKPGSPTNIMNANKMPVRRTEDVLVFYRELPTFNRSAVAHKVEETFQSSNSSNVYEGSGIHKGNTYTQEWSQSISDVIKTKRDIEHHPTEKPITLLSQLILTYTDEGETVLDFTMGSGSTGVAAVQEGRNFIGMEMDEEYFNTAKKRIESAERKQDKVNQFFDV